MAFDRKMRKGLEQADDNLAVDALLKVHSEEDQNGLFLERLKDSLRQLRTTQRVFEAIPKGRQLLKQRFFWSLAASIAILFSVIYASFYYLISTSQPATGIRITTTNSLVASGNSSIIVTVADFLDPMSPCANVAIKLLLRDKSGTKTELGTVTSDSNGVGIYNGCINVPPGNYILEAVDCGDDRAICMKSVSVVSDYRCYLATDKPIYQPGQTIHIRGVCKHAGTRRPLKDKSVEISLSDPKGNTIFQKKCRTSDYGICSADVELANIATEGSYTIYLSIAEYVVKKSVRVGKYSLPKFDIQFEANRKYYKPGDTFSGQVRCDYIFGKPVKNADVSVQLSEYVDSDRVFAQLLGHTDQQGIFRFEAPLKKTFAGKPINDFLSNLQVNVQVTDQADHVQQRKYTYPVSNQPFIVDVIPDDRELSAGLENTFHILTYEPDGTPIQADITIMGKQVKTGKNGYTAFKYTPVRERDETTDPDIVEARAAEPYVTYKGSKEIAVTARSTTGQLVKKTFDFSIDSEDSTFLFTTDKCSYSSDETIEFRTVETEGNSRYVLSIVKNGHCIYSKMYDVKGKEGHFAFELSPEMTGLISLRLLQFSPSGFHTIKSKLVRVTPCDRLNVTASLSKKSYLPGEKAIVDLAVTDTNNTPTVAALSLSVVDQAVFALPGMQPDVERAYFAIQEELLEPRVELHQSNLEDLHGLELKRSGRAYHRLNFMRWYDHNTLSQREYMLHMVRMDDILGFLRSCLIVSPLILLNLLFSALLVYTSVTVVRNLKGAGLPGSQGSQIRRLRWAFSLGVFVPFTAVCVYLAPVVYNSIVYRLVPMASYVQTWAWYGFHRDFLNLFMGISGVIIGCVFLYLLFAAIYGYEERVIYRRICLLLLLLYSSAVLVVVAPFVVRQLSYHTSGHLIDFDIAYYVLMAIISVALPEIAFSSFALAITKQKWGTMRKSGLVIRVFLLVFLVIAIYMQTYCHSFGFLSGAGNNGEGPLEIQNAQVKAQVTSLPPAKVRRYFPETLYWQPEVITDEQGKCRLEILLADSITTWKLSASALSTDGALGGSTKDIQVFQDFFIDIDAPLELVQGDTVSIPIAIYNYLKTPQVISIAVEKAEGIKVVGVDKTIKVQPSSVASTYLRVAAIEPGTHRIIVKAGTPSFADAVERQITVVPDGRKEVKVVNDCLRGKRNIELILPTEAIPTSRRAEIRFYSSSISHVIQSMDSIFRMPHGCFEQTSSTTYPNVLALLYMKNHAILNPETELRARKYTSIGYQRLLTFEVKGGGFDWYGRAPAKLMLSAYGLMEFRDMSKVQFVDPKVIERTEKWLYSQQQQDGSWGEQEGHQKHLATTAYIAWALSEGGNTAKLDKALNFIENNAAEAKDSYTLALCANALLAGKRDASQFLEKLEAKVTLDKDTAHWQTQQSGLFYSAGRSMTIETTALAAQALAQQNKHHQLLPKALDWLIAQKDSHGTWHSTQSTIQTLRALLAGTEMRQTGEIDLDLLVAGKKIGKLHFDDRNRCVVQSVDLTEYLSDAELTLVPSSKNPLPYQVVYTYYVPWQRTTSAPPPLAISATYDTSSLQVADILTCDVTLESNLGTVADMLIVDIGIPAGFQLQQDGLRKLVQAGVLDRYSVTRQQAVLYVRRLAPGRKIGFPIQMKAKYPIRTETKPLTLYEYYRPERRNSTTPTRVTVTP